LQTNINRLLTYNVCMILGDQEFQKRYKNLNKEQKLAVDEIYGPVMVIAGPGTGKTTILTLRIAQILRLTDTSPEAILALTFTDSGAEAMRKKLAEIIGPLAFRVRIGTFHSFAGELISEYPNYFSKIIGGRLISEIEQIRIIRKILDENKFKKLTPQGDRFYYTKKIINAIQHLKLENLKPLDLDKFTTEELKNQKPQKNNISILNKLENNQDLIKVFKEYEKKLKQQKLYDFEDVLVETIKALRENQGFLAEIREGTHFVMADEHQDANGAQNEILELLAGFDDIPNLFIVGDEKQAIYRFQGASLENFLYFKKKFKKAKIITLINNYRSGQALLDASHSLISNLEKSNEIDRPRLIGRESAKQNKPEIELLSFESEEAEMNFVLDKAQKINKQKYSVAILTRKNKDAEDISEYAKRLKIPIFLNSGKEIFSNNEVNNLLDIIYSINDLCDNEKLFKTLLVNFLKIDIVDSFRLNREIRERKLDKKYLIDLISNQKILDSLGLNNSRQILTIAQNLKRWAEFAKNELLTDAIDLIAKESGFVNKLFTTYHIDESIALYEGLHKFARSVSENNRKAQIDDLIISLDLIKNHNAKILSKTGIQDNDKIQIMTMHKSKGLEFDFILLFKADDSRLGKKITKNSFFLPSQVLGHLIKEEEDDEKRLFYVALTRAKKEAFITFPLISDDGKALTPSRFISDIKSNLLTVTERKDYQTKFLTKLNENDTTKNDLISEPTKEVSIYARNLFLEKGLNATALNNYLKCPWQYFFQNLIRIPKNMAEHQIYGSAIHSALNFTFLEIKQNKKKPPIQKIYSHFKQYLGKTIIDSKTEKRLLERGKKVLDLFIPTINDKILDFKTEHKISGVPVDIDSGVKINLSGKLDLIEKISGGYKVLDFKTGNPKSRNDILGSTKSSSGDIYRQLVFYKILIENQSQNLGQMELGEIQFVEPAKNGKLRNEIFSITDREKNDLMDVIKKTAEEILDLQFWQKTCADKKCEFCEMAQKIKGL